LKKKNRKILEAATYVEGGEGFDNRTLRITGFSDFVLGPVF
jgi:hypothetical protein